MSMFMFEDAEEGPKVCQSKMVSLLSAFRHEVAKESDGGARKGKFVFVSNLLENMPNAIRMYGSHSVQTIVCEHYMLHYTHLGPP